MSSTPSLSDETKPHEGSVTDNVAAAPNYHEPDEGTAATRFPKALKAKKKQKRLAAKPSREDGVEDVKQENIEAREPEVPEQEARDPASPREEHRPRREKISKNRRKREARAAAALVDGEQGEAEGQPRSEPANQQSAARGVEQSAGGKREARDGKARETKKAADAKDEAPPKKEPWQLQKAALKEKFPEGWSPRKRLSPDALAGIRALHQQFPEEYTTEVLANKFEVSPEAIRRILKSKWEPQPEEEIDRQERWFSRGKRIWSAWAEEGKKPPAKWRKEGITRDPSYHEQRRARSIAQRKLAKTLM